MKSYFGQMMWLFVVCFVGLSAIAFASDDEQRCSVGPVSTVEHRDGVTVRTVSFVEDPPQDQLNAGAVSKRKISAHVYIPESSDPVPAILFSHSSIHNYQGTTSLLPFAFAMARAGAASIVLDRAIQWEPYDEQANRDPSLMDCAARWFVREVKLDLTRMASSGTYHFPQFIHPLAKWAPTSAAGYGTLGPAEFINTKNMMSAKGQARLALFFKRELGLREANPDWFSVATMADGQQIAASK